MEPRQVQRRWGFVKKILSAFVLKTLISFWIFKNPKAISSSFNFCHAPLVHEKATRGLALFSYLPHFSHISIRFRPVQFSINWGWVTTRIAAWLAFWAFLYSYVNIYDVCAYSEMWSVRSSNMFLYETQMLLYVYNTGPRPFLHIHELSLCHEF